MSSEKHHVIEAKGRPAAVVVFLHGLGSSGLEWYERFKLIARQDIRYIFPDAPVRPITLGGMSARAWFDLKGLDPNTNEDEEGIMIAASELRRMVEVEMKDHGLPSDRVLIGGFSMGGALALYTALTYDDPLGGAIVLSSWLPLKQQFLQSRPGHDVTKQSCRVFQAHGADDAVVQLQSARDTHHGLKVKVDRVAHFNVYPALGHEASAEEMQDVARFIDDFCEREVSS